MFRRNRPHTTQQPRQILHQSKPSQQSINLPKQKLQNETLIKRNHLSPTTNQNIQHEPHNPTTTPTGPLSLTIHLTQLDIPNRFHHRRPFRIIRIRQIRLTGTTRPSTNIPRPIQIRLTPNSTTTTILRSRPNHDRHHRVTQSNNRTSTRKNHRVHRHRIVLGRRKRSHTPYQVKRNNRSNIRSNENIKNYRTTVFGIKIR